MRVRVPFLACRCVPSRMFSTGVIIMPQKKWYQYFPRMTFATIGTLVVFAIAFAYDYAVGNDLTSTINQFALVCGYLTSSWLVVIVGVVSSASAKKLPAKPPQPEERREMSNLEFVILLCIVAAVTALATWWGNTHPFPEPSQPNDEKVIVIPWGG